MRKTPETVWFRRLLLVVLVLVLPLAFLGYKVWFDPSVQFLTPSWRADWAVWSSPLTADHWAAWRPGQARFIRQFYVHAIPARMALQARGFTHISVILNGRVIAPTVPIGNWKCAARFNLTPYLNTGGNTLQIAITNDHAVPALLVEEPAFLRTPVGWLVTMDAPPAGYVPAVSPADIPTHAGPIQTIPAWRWLRWLFVGWIAANVGLGAWALGKTWRQPLADGASQGGGTRRHILILMVILLACLGLNLRNAEHYAPDQGPDAQGHMQHILQVARTWRPAIATDGWEAYQPPLYYFTAAAVYRLAGGAAAAPASFKYVQYLGAWAGVGLALLGWRYARLLLPADRNGACVAALFVAFVPLALCVNPLCNNETFSALVSAAVFCVMLRWAAENNERGSTPTRALFLGLLVGLTLLSRFSAVLLLGCGALALLPPPGRRQTTRYLGLAALFGAGVLVVCGWYYARNIALFGDPFYGNWRADPHDQTPTYRWLGFYTQAGYALFLHPDAAQWVSWWDGLYASFWTGERMFYFAPWMTRALALLSVIMVLGLPVTAAILLGFLHTGVSALRQPAASRGRTDLLLTALTIWTILAATWFSIRIPANGTVTARYLLYLLPCLAVFLARGRLLLDACARWVRRLLDLDLALLTLLVIYVYRLGVLRE